MIVHFKKNNDDAANDADFFLCLCRSLLLYEYDNDYTVDLPLRRHSKSLLPWLEIACSKTNQNGM